MMLKISDSSIKGCREKFPIKRIGKIIKSTLMLFDLVPVEEIISECIYDCYNTNTMLYNVILYLIRENCTDEKIINALCKFEYKEAL